MLLATAAKAQENPWKDVSFFDHSATNIFWNEGTRDMAYFSRVTGFPIRAVME